MATDKNNFKEQKIGDYVTKKILGQGNYGIVFLVIKEGENVFYVLKQIFISNISKLEEVEKESKILQSLNSQFIVRHRESFVSQSYYNIVMEYCEAGDLSEYLRMRSGKVLDEDEIWKFFIQICLGLAYIHNKKIIHRDLKTLNIFLTKEGKIKIGDLGVAKELCNTNHARSWVGTPYYLSPEMCYNKPYNQKSDIWALGCILYEMTTLRHPFDAKNFGSLLFKIMKDKHDPISSPNYSLNLKQMVDLLLEKNSSRRPSINDVIKHPNFRSKAKALKMFDMVNSIYEEINPYNSSRNRELKVRQIQTSKKRSSDDRIVKVVTPNSKKSTNATNIANNLQQDKQQQFKILNKFEIPNNYKPKKQMSDKKLQLNDFKQNHKDFHSKINVIEIQKSKSPNMQKNKFENPKKNSSPNIIRVKDVKQYLGKILSTKDEIKKDKLNSPRNCNFFDLPKIKTPVRSSSKLFTEIKSPNFFFKNSEVSRDVKKGKINQIARNNIPGIGNINLNFESNNLIYNLKLKSNNSGEEENMPDMNLRKCEIKYTDLMTNKKEEDKIEIDKKINFSQNQQNTKNQVIATYDKKETDGEEIHSKNFKVCYEDEKLLIKSYETDISSKNKVNDSLEDDILNSKEKYNSCFNSEKERSSDLEEVEVFDNLNAFQLNKSSDREGDDVMRNDKIYKNKELKELKELFTQKVNFYKEELVKCAGDKNFNKIYDYFTNINQTIGNSKDMYEKIDNFIMELLPSKNYDEFSSDFYTLVFYEYEFDNLIESGKKSSHKLNKNVLI